MTPSSTPLRLALLVSATLALAACGGGSDNATPAPTPTPPPPAPTAEELANGYIQALTQLTAQTVPAKGEDRYALLDACYLGQGNTKDRLIANWNASPAQTQANNAYLVGRSYQNMAVVTERKSTNADGSARREIDISYDEVFADGSSATKQTETLITGSSADSCATPQTGDGVRAMGNRRKFTINLIGRNLYQINNNLSDGTAINQRVRREMRIRLADPAELATYAIVTWPSGIAGAAPLSLKMLSPRLVREAAEMQSKPGNGNYANTDFFRICGSDSGFTTSDASTANCTQFGTTGENWGASVNAPFTATSLADGDRRFEAYGFTAGAQMQIQLFNDDGWKTVNGQQGKTPVASYTVTLSSVPYTFMALGTAPASYTYFDELSLSNAAIAAALRGSGASLTAKWTPAVAPAGYGKLVATDLGVFRQGPSATTGQLVRVNTPFVPVASATSGTISIGGKIDGTTGTTYGEYSLTYSDRSGHQVTVSQRFN